jgi:hypothetical protein
LRPAATISAWATLVAAASIGLGVSRGSGCVVGVATTMVELEVGPAAGVEVDIGSVLATSIWVAGVKAERSSRTIVGVGLALLGDAQAVNINKVSKIKVVQILIFISHISNCSV